MGGLLMAVTNGCAPRAIARLSVQGLNRLFVTRMHKLRQAPVIHQRGDAL